MIWHVLHFVNTSTWITKSTHKLDSSRTTFALSNKSITCKQYVCRRVVYALFCYTCFIIISYSSWNPFVFISLSYSARRTSFHLHAELHLFRVSRTTWLSTSVHLNSLTVYTCACLFIDLLLSLYYSRKPEIRTTTL